MRKIRGFDYRESLKKYKEGASLKTKKQLENNGKLKKKYQLKKETRVMREQAMFKIFKFAYFE